MTKAEEKKVTHEKDKETSKRNGRGWNVMIKTREARNTGTTR